MNFEVFNLQIKSISEDITTTFLISVFNHMDVLDVYESHKIKCFSFADVSILLANVV